MTAYRADAVRRLEANVEDLVPGNLSAHAEQERPFGHGTFSAPVCGLQHRLAAQAQANAGHA